MPGARVHLVILLPCRPCRPKRHYVRPMHLPRPCTQNLLLWHSQWRAAQRHGTLPLHVPPPTTPPSPQVHPRGPAPLHPRLLPPQEEVSGRRLGIAIAIAWPVVCVPTGSLHYIFVGGVAPIQLQPRQMGPLHPCHIHPRPTLPADRSIPYSLAPATTPCGFLHDLSTSIPTSLLPTAQFKSSHSHYHTQHMPSTHLIS